MDTSKDQTDQNVLNLQSAANRKLLAEQISMDIDQWCSDKWNNGHRNHLGASIIGDECERKLWNIFRWVKRPKFTDKDGNDNTGRMMRLFQRGHLEEFRFIEYLKGIGFEVFEFQDDGKTQWRIVDVMGHFGGSMDGKSIAPERYNLMKGLKLLLEFKTMKSGTYFKKLKLNGVKLEKPVHFDQMCSYGFKERIEYALYQCVEKDTDDIHTEIVKLDWKRGEELIRKAEGIITSQIPPTKINLSAARFPCNWCDFKGICHNNDAIEANCRSCKFAHAVQDKEWLCSFQDFNQNIPKDIIPKGCKNWEAIC